MKTKNILLTLIISFAGIPVFAEGGTIDIGGIDDLTTPAAEIKKGDEAAKKDGSTANKYGRHLLKVENANGEALYFDKNGTKKLGPFEYGFPFSEGYAYVNNNGNAKLLDANGKEKADEKFYYAGSYSSGLAFVYIDKEGLYGYADHKGKIIHKGYELPDPRAGRMNTTFVNGFAEVLPVKGGWALINKEGKVLMSNQPAGRIYLNGTDGIAAIPTSDGKRYYFMNTEGKTPAGLKQHRHPTVRGFYHGYAAIEPSPKKWAFIDMEGRVFPKSKTFIRVGDFGKCGLAPVLLETKIKGKKGKGGGTVIKWGAINSKGALKIKAKFEHLGEFSEGLAVYMDEKTQLYGFVNTKGKVEIPAEYDDAEKFINGVAAVTKNGKYCYLSTTGKIVFTQ